MVKLPKFLAGALPEIGQMVTPLQCRLSLVQCRLLLAETKICEKVNL
jgi:hypothetical protein